MKYNGCTAWGPLLQIAAGVLITYVGGKVVGGIGSALKDWWNSR